MHLVPVVSHVRSWSEQEEEGEWEEEEGIGGDLVPIHKSDPRSSGGSMPVRLRPSHREHLLSAESWCCYSAGQSLINCDILERLLGRVGCSWGCGVRSTLVEER